MATPTVVTRYIGICQICEGEFKLDQAKNMVHHGYKRPGYGYIVGDCRAVGAPAYEQSCEVLKDHTKWLKSYLKAEKKRLTQLRNGEVTEIIRTYSHYRKPDETIVHKQGEADFWKVLENEIFNQNQLVEMVERDVTRCEKRIAAWKLLPVRTIDEAEAVKRASKEVAQAARDAKKAAKLADKIAGYQKRLDSAVRRKTKSVIAEIFDTAPSKLRDIAGLHVTHTEALQMLKRDHLWAAFGLDIQDPRSRPNADLMGRMRYGFETEREVQWPEGI